MYKFKSSILIRRKIDEVFKFYTDFKWFCTVWNDVLSMNKITEGPIVKGSKYENIMLHNGKDFKFQSEILDITHDKTFAFNTTRYGVKVIYSYEFNSVKEGTLINFKGQVLFNDYPEQLCKEIFNAIVEEDEDHLSLIKSCLEMEVNIAI